MSIQPPKYDHSQTDSEVHVAIYVPNLDSKSVHVTLKSDTTLNVDLGKQYGQLTWDLYGPVVLESDASWTVTPYKLEIALKKKHHGHQWPTLEKAATTNVQTLAQQQQHSKWSQFDHTDMIDDAKHDEMDVFRRLYADGDDDSRRAMMKSFSESNGTSLSNVWKDVGQRVVAPVESTKKSTDPLQKTITGS